MVAIGIVKDYIRDLQQPFLKVEHESEVDLQTIGKDVYDAVQPPPADDTT